MMCRQIPNPKSRIPTFWVLAFGIWVLTAAPAASAERYAVIVSGVSGGEKYAAQQKQWREEVVTFLTVGLAVPDANLVVLDEASEGSSTSTAANIRRVLGDLRRRVMGSDTMLLVLLGHGTYDGIDAKFNLVGPDLSAPEWKDVLDGLAGRVIVVNTTASSFPFLEQLSSKGRVVITATDSAKQHYEQRGQLSTERPLIDDDGDGLGREAGAPGADGTLAGTVYLDPDPGTLTSGDAEVAALERQRLVLVAQLEALKEKKASMSDDQYQAELEKILVELARIAQQIRQRS
jgi:hypothetical protein